MSPTHAPERRAGRTAAAVAAGTAALAIALSACSSSVNTSSGENTNFVAGTGQITFVKPADRKPAPNLTGKSLTGTPISVAAHRGKVVVINIFGEWCGPCGQEAPHFSKVSQADKGKDVQFMGIDTRDVSPANGLAFERHYKLSYPSFFDPDGALLLKFPRGSLNPQAIPSTLIIDRHGRIAARALRPLSLEDLNALIEPALAES